MNKYKSTIIGGLILGSFILFPLLSHADDFGTGPNLVKFESATANGTYGAGSPIDITATFDTTIDPNTSPTMNVTLDDGATVDLTTANGNQLSGTYTVQNGDHSTDLNVSTINYAYNIRDLGTTVQGNSYSNIPSGQNLADNTNIVISAPAMFTSGELTNTTITLTYSFDLDNSSIPASGDFVVHNTTTGTTINVSSVDISGTLVTLGLAHGVSNDDTITLDYTPGTNPIKDIDNNQVDALSGQSILHSAAVIPVGINPFVSTIVGKSLYVANETSNSISVVNLDSTQSTYNTVIATISVGSKPRYMSVVGKKIYVSNYDSANISVIDADPTSGTYNTVISTISVGTNPRYSSVSGTNVYVSNVTASTVSVIDANPRSGSYNTVIATIPVKPTTSNNVNFNPGASVSIGDKVYLMNYGYATDTGLAFNNVVVIDADPTSGTYNTVISNIAAGSAQVYYPTISGNNLYISNTSSTNLTVIDTDPASGTYNTVIAHASLGGKLAQYLAAVGKRIYANIPDMNKVYVVDADPTSGTYNTVTATIDVGQSPQYSTLVGSKLYVVNTNSHDVSVIDTNTNTVTKTIPVLDDPQYAIAAGTKLYVHNSSGSLSVIDTVTDKIFNLVGPHLKSITSSSANGRYTSGQSIAITANFDNNISSDSKMRITLNSGAIIDLSSVSGNTLNGTYIVGNTDSSPDLTVSSISNNSAFTSISNSDPVIPNTVSAFDVPLSPELTGDSYGNLGDLKNIAVGASTCNITVGVNPYQLAAVGNIIYVANQGSNTVSVINSDTDVILSTIDVGNQPYGVAYNSTSKEIYVANLTSNDVSVIDADPASTHYNTVTHTVNVGISPFYVTSLGTNMYVTNHGSNSVSIIDTVTHTVTDTVNVGIAPLGIKAHGTDIYVANYGGGYGGMAQGTVSVIDTGTNTVTKTINVGQGARGVTVNGNEVYVSNYGDATVSVIDTGTNTVTHTISVGNNPRGMLSLGSNVYTENYTDGTLSVISTASHSVTGTYKVGNTPAGMVAVGSKIFISRFTDDVVSIFNTADNTLVSSCYVAPVSSGGGSSRVVGTSGGSSTNSLTTDTKPNIASTTSPLASSTAPFTKNLFLGVLDNEVVRLQQYLNSHGFILAKIGAGSPGKETRYFGPITQSAVARFQKANKIIPSAGYFGPKTRAYINLRP